MPFFSVLRVNFYAFCLFVWIFSSHSRFFHSYGDVTITGERLQIMTYARPTWQLRSKGSLACHTYCDTGHPFIMVISEYPRFLMSGKSGSETLTWEDARTRQEVAVTTCFNDKSVTTGDRTPISRTRGENSTTKPPWRFKRKVKKTKQTLALHFTW